MAINSNKYQLTRNEEKLLRQRLAKTVWSMLAILAALGIILGFFAPKLGAFFGFFSVHRNEKDATTIIKPAAPLFVNTPKAVKEDSVNLNGFAQAGSTVTLFVNGPEVQKTTAGSDGMFTFNNVGLMQGINTIFAKIADQNGTESDNSNTISITVDKEKPKITVEGPKANETVRNLDKRIKVYGKLNEMSSVMINDKIAIVRPEDLSFEILLGATEGTMEIKIQATDTAGNVSEEKFSIKYVKGS